VVQNVKERRVVWADVMRVLTKYFLVFCLYFCWAFWTSAANAQKATPFSIEAYKISSLSLDRKDQTRFGALTFKGGLVLSSDNRDFGALSGLRFRDLRSMIAVTDTGFWISATVQRNADGTPVGFDDGQIAPLRDGDGSAILQKWSADIEGVTLDGSDVFISTEQDSRVLLFSKKDGLPQSGGTVFGPRLPAPRLDYSFGLEAIATIPPRLRARMGGARVVAIGEGEPGKPDPFRGFLINQQSIEEFSIVRSGEYLVTDADFLPSGDLLLLERHFSPTSGANMRIRKIAATAITAGSKVDGETLIELGPRHQIDNMEGMSVVPLQDGSVRIALVSDNNQWLLQRTLYLEFTLDGARE